MTFKFYLRMVAAAMTVLFMAVGCSDDKTDDPPVTPPVDPTVNCTFAPEVYNVSDVMAFGKAHPSDATVTYYMGVAKKSLFDTFASDKAFQTNDVESLKKKANDDNLAMSEYLKQHISVGDVPTNFSNLEPNTDYFLYAYGLSMNGDITTDLAKVEFKTEAAKVPMTFEIAVSGITPYGATVAVKPSAKGTYYYDVFEKAEMDKFASDAAVIAELEKNPDFSKGLVTGDQSHTYGEGAEALKPKTEYYAYAFEYGNPTIQVPTIKKVPFTTKSDEPFDATYESWLGKWKVTSSSSMKGNRPLEFEIEINRKVAGVSYTVKNWGITPWASKVVVEARYHGTADEVHEKGSLSFMNQQSFGPLDSESPAYDLEFINYYDNGGKPMIVTGNYNDFTGVLTSEDSGKMGVYDLELKNTAGETFTRTMVGADIFGLDIAQGKFGTYNPVKAYEELGYPVGPYTLTWVGEVDNPNPEGEAPTLELTAVSGNGQGGETESKVTVMAKSSGATSGRYGLFNKAEVDALIEAQGVTLEAIIAQNGNPLSAERLAKMNSADGLVLTFVELDPDTEWIAIYSASNEYGTTVDSAVASTTGSQVGPSDLTLTIAIDAQTQIPGGVHATVTASNATDKWLPVFLLAEEVDGVTDANLIKGIEQMFGGNISRALTTGNLETTAATFAGKNALIPGADYYLVAFGHTGVGATTSVFKQKFTAGAGPDAAGITFTINVTDITATEAKVSVAASKEPVVYMTDIFTQDDFTQMDGADGLAKYYQDMFAFYATKNYSPLAVIQGLGAWYSGYEYVYDALDSNTTYIPTAICIDLNGNVIGTATVGASFTTQKADPSQVVTATTSYSKYYDGDDVAANGGSADAAGHAFVPTTVTKSANAAHFISGLFGGDYTDPTSVTDAVIIQNLEKNFISMKDKAQTNWLANWDEKCTFFAVATDAAGKYGPVHRLGGLFTKSGVSPISDLLGAPAQRSTLSKRPYLCSSMLPELVVPMIFRPIESGLLSVKVIEPRSSQVRQTLEVSDLKAFEAVDSDVLSNGLMTLGKPMRYMVAAEVQTGTVKNLLRPVKKVEAAFKLGTVRNE